MGTRIPLLLYHNCHDVDSLLTHIKDPLYAACVICTALPPCYTSTPEVTVELPSADRYLLPLQHSSPAGAQVDFSQLHYVVSEEEGWVEVDLVATGSTSTSYTIQVTTISGSARS